MLSSTFFAKSTTPWPKTSPSFWVTSFTASRTLLVLGSATIPPSILLTAPTLGEIDIPLSLRMRITSRSECPALLIPSYERPQVKAPSPTTATTLLVWPRRSRAVAIPKAADIAVPACPAPNWSWGFSLRLRKPEIPPSCRRVPKRSFRPVRSFQAYAWKLLTGRNDRFGTLRQEGGISGFLKRSENPHDQFGAGHAGTAMSAAFGMATARDLLGQTNKVVAVVGDGAFTCGLSYEGMNNAGHSDRDVIPILNANGMSISPNVGAVSKMLGGIVRS